MKPRGIIFDMDGTLAYTLPAIAQSANRVLKSKGYPEHPEKSYAAKTGMGLLALIKQSLPKEVSLSSEALEELGKEFWQSYMADPLYGTVLYPGMEKVLKYLKQRGIQYAVNTNKEHTLAYSIGLSVLPGLTEPFFEGRRDGKPGKPSPEGALRLAGRMELSPEQIVYIGDSPVDARTAGNGGFRFGACFWGYGEEKTLLSVQPYYSFFRPDDILNII